MTADPVAALTFREGEHSDLRAAFTLAELAVHDTARRTGVLATDPPSDEQIERDWHQRRDLLEFTAAQDGGGFWVCEDEGRADRLRAGVPVRRDGAAHGADGAPRVPRQRHRPRTARPPVARRPHPRPRPARGGCRCARRPHAVRGLRGDARDRPLAHARLRGGVPRAARAGDRLHRPARARALAGARRRRSGSVSSRRRSATSGRMLHDFFGRTRTCLATMDAEAHAAPRRCAGSTPAGRWARRWRPRRRTWCRWCSRRSTGWR